MKVMNFIEEKIIMILFFFLLLITIDVFLYFLNIPFSLIGLLSIILIIIFLSYFIITYVKALKTFKNIRIMVDDLEEKYLIAEILKKPVNLENQGYYYALLKACKAMNDKISEIDCNFREYKEYLETFGHEIKTPISALLLSLDNSNQDNLKLEVLKIENLVQQMLYYARSDSPDKDYFVRDIKLSDVVHLVIMKYKDYLLKDKIILDTHDLEYIVYTDSKWTTFILGQIMQNSIKYMDKSEKILEIWGEENHNNVVLCIKDNGCGIKKSDLPRVFDKGFTGFDRGKKYSTGMGLYLVKKLCERLDLNVTITSKESEYTTVKIVFPKGNVTNINDL